MASVQDVVGGIASDDGLNRACLLPYKYRSHLDHDLYRCRRHRTSLLQPWSVPLFTLETHPTKRQAGRTWITHVGTSEVDDEYRDVMGGSERVTIGSMTPVPASQAVTLFSIALLGPYFQSHHVPLTSIPPTTTTTPSIPSGARPSPITCTIRRRRHRHRHGTRTRACTRTVQTRIIRWRPPIPLRLRLPPPTTIIDNPLIPRLSIASLLVAGQK